MRRVCGNEEREMVVGGACGPGARPGIGGSAGLPGPRFITVAQAAAMLTLSESAMRAMIKRRQFPGDVLLRLGKRSLRFDTERLAAWIRSRSTRPGP